MKLEATGQKVLHNMWGETENGGGGVGVELDLHILTQSAETGGSSPGIQTYRK